MIHRTELPRVADRAAWSVEVHAITDDYARYDRDPTRQTLWTPFHPVEEDHRVQQYRIMAGLFRTIGRTSLAGWRILDVGCGPGRLVRSFIDLGAEPSDLVGLEIQPGRLELARRLSPHVTFALGDGCDLPFRDRRFDLVTQFVVFSSIGAAGLRGHLAREMVRVTAPGGYIFWWDLLRTVAPREKGQTMDLDQLFPGLARRSLTVGLKARPSECLRPSRLLRWLGPLLDRFAVPATHVGALIGPLPGPAGGEPPGGGGRDSDPSRDKGLPS
jgi:SAM-dependent methyltransferase